MCLSSMMSKYLDSLRREHWFWAKIQLEASIATLAATTWLQEVSWDSQDSLRAKTQSEFNRL